MATKTSSYSVVEKKEIRVSFNLDPRVTDSNGKISFSVLGNLKEKSKSYPSICSALAEILKNLIDPGTIAVEDFIPTTLSLKEFDSKCLIKFRRRGIVKSESRDPDVTVVADLEECQVFIPLTEFNR